MARKPPSRASTPEKTGGGAVSAPARRAGMHISGFDAASHGRRTKNWHASDAGINTLLMAGLEVMRNRTRDQARNNPWVRKATRSYVSNIVGDGIRPIPKTPDEEFNKALAALWNDWVKESDADGLLDFYGQQTLAVRAFRTAGEVLLRKIYRPTDQFDLALPLQYQIIESDQLDHTYNNPLLENGGRIIQGVEFDADNIRVAYWLWKRHPREWLGGFAAAERIRVPASEILHIFEPDRPGQVRGYPGMVSTIIRMLDTAEYEDAELMRKKLTAMWVAFITSAGDENPASDLLNATTNANCAPASGSSDAPAPQGATIEPGTIQQLDPGQDIVFNTNKDVNGSFEPFVQMMLRAAAAGSDVTYEQMTGDMTSVNFSSARVALNEMQRLWKQIRANIVIHQLCNPVWREFVLWAVKTGAVKLPKDFTARRREYQRAHWRAPGWPYVSPLDEARATQIMLRNGLTSRAHEVAESGEDINELDAQIAADNERADKLDLVFDSDPRATDVRGQSQLAPPPPDESAQQIEDNNKRPAPGRKQPPQEEEQ